MSGATELAIVGGGLAGLATAWQLERRGRVGDAGEARYRMVPTMAR